MDARYFLISTDGRHYGPLSADDVRTWLADGRASRHSRSRRDSEERWQPLREMPEFEEATRPPMVGSVLDSADASRVGEPGAVEGTDEGPQLDPVSCFQRGWYVLMQDFALLTGWTLLVSIAVGAAGFVPRVGLLAAFITDQVLRPGLYVLDLSRIRGNPQTAWRAATIVAASLPTLLLAALAQLALETLGLFLLILPGIYLVVGYAFTLPLIVDRGMPAWAAMELSRTTVHRHWWSVFGLLLAQAALIVLGALAAGIGLVFAMPFCTAALMVAYEELFGRR